MMHVYDNGVYIGQYVNSYSQYGYFLYRSFEPGAEKIEKIMLLRRITILDSFKTGPGGESLTVIFTKEYKIMNLLKDCSLSFWEFS